MSLTLALAIATCVLLGAAPLTMFVVWRLRKWADGMVAAFPELLEVARQQTGGGGGLDHHATRRRPLARGPGWGFSLWTRRLLNMWGALHHMVHLPAHVETNGSQAIVPREAEPYEPAGLGGSRFASGNDEDSTKPPALAVPSAAGKEEPVVLFARISADTHRNGQLVVLAIQVFCDRYEISVTEFASGNWRRDDVSSEQSAQAEPSKTTQDSTVCQRCVQPIADAGMTGQYADPCCKARRQEDDNLPNRPDSVSYSLCDQPAAVDAGYRQTPEPL